MVRLCVGSNSFISFKSASGSMLLFQVFAIPAICERATKTVVAPYSASLSRIIARDGCVPVTAAHVIRIGIASADDIAPFPSFFWRGAAHPCLRLRAGPATAGVDDALLGD